MNVAGSLTEKSGRTAEQGLNLRVLLVALGLLAIGFMVNLSIGALKTVNPVTVFDALVRFDGSQSHQVVRLLRVPRALTAGLVGSSLAVAGVLMQGITRNPLASPALFGVNAGASVLVVGGLALWPGLSGSMLAAAAFGGAATGGIVVFLMGKAGSRQMDPVRLALAGVTVTALLTSLTQSILIFNESTVTQVIYWLTGAVDGRDWSHVRILLPWSIMGMIGAFALAKPLDLLSLGEETAKGLGQNTERIRLLSGLGVVLLAGAAVAVAGPISFVGLIVPHIARRYSCLSHIRLIPLSAVLGAVLLIYADIAARFVAYPFESPVGIITALLGAPYFLYLARRERGSS